LDLYEHFHVSSDICISIPCFK